MEVRDEIPNHERLAQKGKGFCDCLLGSASRVAPVQKEV